MSRDMQIGLLLAVGFLALVGGVLYYRIEHPDELEQYLAGGTAEVDAKGTEATKPENAPKVLAQNTPSSNSTLPTPPVATTPVLEPIFPVAGSTTSNPANTAPNPVTLAGGQGGTPTTPSAPPSGNSFPGVPLAPVIVFPGNDGKTASENKKPDDTSATRKSLPTEPIASSLPPAPPSGAPSLSLDVNGTKPPPPMTTAAEQKKVEEKKPAEVVVKPDNSPGFNLPIVPALVIPKAVAGVVGGSNDKLNAPPENKSLEMPQPPVVSPPTTAMTPPAATTPPSNTMAPPPVNTAPPLGNTANNSAPQNTIPETVIKPNQPPVKEAVPVTATATPSEADGMRSYAPRAGLGKPMPESESQLREKRWADGAGTPAPIVPSSATMVNRNNGGTTPSGTVGERRVVQDTYIPRERALKGETFTSLSQRLYGDTNYAVALAAYNKEEGFVTMDQPEANEWIAKPNREILDQRYPNLIRRLNPTPFTQKTVQGATPTDSRPASTGKNPTYRVGKGEQLFEVAKKTLGDGYRWSEIYALNKDLLRDSTELRPDMVLKLPGDAKK